MIRKITNITLRITDKIQLLYNSQITGKSLNTDWLVQSILNILVPVHDGM